MRRAGLPILGMMIVAATSVAQPPAVPGVPPPVPAAVAAPDQKLDAHLASWERAMGEMKNFRFALALIRTDPAAGIFKGEKKYKGSILCMKPNLARMRLDYEGDTNDFEAFICDGKSVFVYNGLQRTITQHKLPDPKANPGAMTDNFILDFMNGMKAKDLKSRFEIKIFKEDQYYVYLDVKPVQAKDKEEFKQLRLALYGPGTGDVAYLPAQVFMVKPNDDTEQWKLSDPKKNIEGITEKVFQYENVPGFRFQQAPEQKAPVRPGQPTLPKGPGR